MVQGAQMKRLTIGIVVLLFIAGLVIPRRALATTYYIAANGSDSNNGTSKTTPWLHAPGMTGCAVTCASTTPQPGDSLIFRGGDTWHYGNSGLTPYVGGTSPHWNFSWSGTSTNCNLDASAGAIVKTSCIYIGVDQTWYSGNSWARPIMNADNPQTTSRPSSCTYDQDGHNFLFIHSYTIVDNFEWLGWCWNSTPNAAVITYMGTMAEVTNNYFHAWTYGSGSNDDEFVMVSCNGTGCTGAEITDHNVFDGSDASLGGLNSGTASGKAVGTSSEVAYNVFWQISNGDVAGTGGLKSVHDNLFYYLVEPQGGVHGNIIEWLGQGSSACTYLYNNLSYVTNEGEGYDMYTGTGGCAYVFNNISWLYRANLTDPPTNGTNGSNCFMEEVSGVFYFFNNTIDSPCGWNGLRGSPNMVLQNNHFIGLSNIVSFAATPGTVTDNGNEVFQSESAANAQGYTPSNNYAPTSSSGASVGAGANLNAFCGGIGDSVAAAACVDGYGGVTYNQTNHTVVANTAVPRPASGSWDAGAYQFSSASVSGQPSPPSDLTAIVQ